MNLANTKVSFAFSKKHSLFIEAEKILFSLKEILVNESSQNLDLMLQVFWGLLACEILNGKGRDVVENTSLKKMRDLIEKKYADDRITDQEHTQLYSWMLHWILIYSFTAKDLTNVGLFASILTNSSQLLQVIQMKSDSLSKYMIASFILARGQPNEKYKINKNALEQIALPILNEAT